MASYYLHLLFQLKYSAVKTISIAQLETCNVSHGFGYVMVMKIVLMEEMRLMQHVVCCL